MPRATNNPASRKRRKKVLKRAKGFWGGRRRLFRTAHETVMRAEVFATRDRKQRKRQFRRLWTVRINAACRQFGISYSRFIAALKKSKIEIDRKSLADLAVRDINAFKKIVDLSGAKKK
jgi:large subunit ribosomal protein L20